MDTFKTCQDLLKQCSNPQWLNNILIAGGIINNENSNNRFIDVQNDYNYLQLKDNFKRPDIIIVANKIVQIIVIGEVDLYNKRNVCWINGIDSNVIKLTSKSIIKNINANIKKFEYLKDTGKYVFYFPFNAASTNDFFNFIELEKNVFLYENLDGQVNNNVKNISFNNLMELIVNDCFNKQ